MSEILVAMLGKKDYEKYIKYYCIELAEVWFYFEHNKGSKTIIEQKNKHYLIC